MEHKSMRSLFLLFFVFTHYHFSYSHYYGVDISHFSASPFDIEKAESLGSIPQDKEIRAYIDSYYYNDYIVERENVAGYTFSNQPKKILDSFKELISEFDIFGRVKFTHSFGSKDLRCKSVRCALDEIFGSDIGQKILYLKLKYGFNSSHLSFINSSPLNLNEINVLLKAIRDYPAFIFPIDKNKQLTKFLRNHQLKIHNSSTIAFAAIAFYDKWSNMNPAEMRYTAFHELAHYIGHSYNLDNNQEWYNISSWVKNNNTWTHLKNDVFPSLYGKENPAEDFAESVAAYRYSPHKLKNISYEKFQYLKELVFRGIDYSQAQTSKFKNSYDYIVLEEFEYPQKDLTSKYNSHKMAREILANCKFNFKEILSFSTPEYTSCMVKGYNHLKLKNIIKRNLHHLKYPHILYKILKSNFENMKLSLIEKDYLYDLQDKLRDMLMQDISYIDLRGEFYSSYSSKRHYCYLWSNKASKKLDSFKNYLGYETDYLSYLDHKEKLGSICEKITEKNYDFNPLNFTISFNQIKDYLSQNRVFYLTESSIQNTASKNPYLLSKSYLLDDKINLLTTNQDLDQNSKLIPVAYDLALEERYKY